MTRYTLYGSPISYFTGKVRAYLDWKGLPYDERPSTAEVFKDIILPRVGFPVIPVVVDDAGVTLQDSTDIIDALERRHGGPAVVPATGLQRLVAALLELYGDEWLVIPAMHYRWHHNRDFALRAFGALSAPDATPEVQLEIGTKRAAPFAQAAELLGASTPAMHAAVERSYEALLAELDAHFAALPYALGTRPSIADFGLYGPLYAHQYRDPASGDLMRRLAPNVVAWVQRLERQAAPGAGEFLPDDAVAPTLAPVLQRQMREQMPVLADSIRLLDAWLASHPGERIPRAIGLHDFALEGVTGQRIARPYSLWMLQRARDVYRGLDATERARADAWLEPLGGAAFLGLPEAPRLVRHGLSVALAT